MTQRGMRVLAMADSVELTCNCLDFSNLDDVRNNHAGLHIVMAAPTASVGDVHTDTSGHRIGVVASLNSITVGTSVDVVRVITETNKEAETIEGLSIAV
jgi:hypothetical protein